MRNLVIIIIIAAFFSGCKKETLDLVPREQKVFFQMEYINYAWGLQHHGWLIDSSGTIYTYDNPQSWNFPDSAGVISQQSMEQNLTMATATPDKIDKKILDEKISLIPKASAGKLSDPRHTMDDFGKISFNAFIFSKEDHWYTRIVLYEYGDWTIINRSPEANALYEWLKTVKPD